jgi:hypothetical protein
VLVKSIVDKMDSDHNVGGFTTVSVRTFVASLRARDSVWTEVHGLGIHPDLQQLTYQGFVKCTTIV